MLTPSSRAGKKATMNILSRILYGPFLAQLVVTRKCNLKCGYCNEFDRTSDPVPTDVLKRRIDKLASLGVFALEFTGGEPMLHPDIFDLIAYATKRRFMMRQIITNAYLLNADKVRRLNNAGLTHMQISLDGVYKNDVTIKVLKPLKKKLLAVAENAGFKVVLSAVIGAAPPEEVLEVIGFAGSAGFTPRVLLIHGEDGQLRLSPENMELFKEVKTRLGGHWKDANDYRTRLAEGETAPFRCRAGARYLYVTEHGKVHWCSQTRHVFGKDLDDYSPRDLRRQFATGKTCTDLCTIGCARSTSKIDEWRPQRPPR